MRCLMALSLTNSMNQYGSIRQNQQLSNQDSVKLIIKSLNVGYDLADCFNSHNSNGFFVNLNKLTDGDILSIYKYMVENSIHLSRFSCYLDEKISDKAGFQLIEYLAKNINYAGRKDYVFSFFDEKFLKNESNVIKSLCLLKDNHLLFNQFLTRSLQLLAPVERTSPTPSLISVETDGETSSDSLSSQFSSSSNLKFDNNPDCTKRAQVRVQLIAGVFKEDPYFFYTDHIIPKQKPLISFRHLLITKELLKDQFKKDEYQEKKARLDYQLNAEFSWLDYVFYSIYNPFDSCKKL